MKYSLRLLCNAFLISSLVFCGCNKNELANNSNTIPANYKSTIESKSTAVKPLYRVLPYNNFGLNKVVEVAGLSSADSAKVQQWDWLNLSSQKWNAEEIEGTYFKLTNSLSGKVLTAPNAVVGSQLVQTTYAANDAQLWKVAPTNQTGLYGLINKNGLAAALENNAAANGTPIIENTKSYTAEHGFIIQKLFNNPLRSSGADPWVIEHNGYYYYTNTTGANVTLYKTKNMSQLGKAAGQVVYTPPPGQPYSDQLWAPEMHFLDGKWYIYVTADDGNDYNHRMYVLENDADDPTTGTWTMKGKISDVSDIWAIDATVLEYGSKKYLIWSGWRFQSTSQYGIQQLYIAEMENPWTITGPRYLISEPTYSWETIGLVNEGPEILKNDDGTVLLVYSCCGCWTDDYKLGMLTLTGTDPLQQSNWSKTPTPVFQKNIPNSVYAPGHNSFFTSPDNTENWIIYHANSASGQGCGGYRSPRMQKFTWNSDGTPSFGIPVSTAESLPVPSGESLK